MVVGSWREGRRSFWSLVISVPGRFKPGHFDPESFRFGGRFGPRCFWSRVISVTGRFGSFSPGSFRFGPWSFQSQVVSNQVISIQSFRFGFVSVPGVFGRGSFRLRVISVLSRFGLGSFISERVDSVQGRFSPGRIGPGLFQSHIVSVPGHSVPGHFEQGRFGLGSWLYICATYLLTYLNMRLCRPF